jgi:uncharacterized protein YfaT (DUF1175 family)
MHPNHPSSFRVSFPLKKITRIYRFLAFFSALLVFQVLQPKTAFCDSSSDSPLTVQPIQTSSQPHQTFRHMRTFFNDVTQYFGTRYRWGGQTPAGFDCSGFVGFMYNKVFNMHLPRTSREMSAIGTKVERDQLQPGDLVFFQSKNQRINHVGIFIGNDTFVHSSTSRGVVEEQLKQNYFEKKFAGAVRLLDLSVNKLPFTESVSSDKAGIVNPS